MLAKGEDDSDLTPTVCEQERRILSANEAVE